MAGTIDRWLVDLSTGRLARRGRPVVVLSYAQSLDGSLALNSGQGLALSGAESMRLTHRLRASCQAILAGIGTVLADDPQLTTRLVDGRSPQPVVLDTYLRLPINCRLMQRADCRPWIFAGQHVDEARAAMLENHGARIFRLPEAAQGRLDIAGMLRVLAEEQVASLMVEGGASVIQTFLAQRLFDYAMVTVAPVWVSGLPVSGARLDRDGSFPALEDLIYEVHGADMVVCGRCALREMGSE